METFEVGNKNWQPIDTSNKIALIDADFLKYLVVSDIIKNEVYADISERTEIIIGFIEKRIEDLLINFECKTSLFCFSGKSSNTFRHQIGFERIYKGNRYKEPAYLEEFNDKFFVMEYIMGNYPSLLFKDLEADDIVSMLQDEDTFIYSRDKDLLQVPGYHYDYKTEQVIEITKDEGFDFLLKQMITGDTVDHITGIKGCGPNKAEKLFKGLTTNKKLSVVLREYIAKNGMVNGIDMFCEMWMLLKMRSNRGAYFKEKYIKAFELLELLKKSKL